MGFSLIYSNSLHKNFDSLFALYTTDIDCRNVNKLRNIVTMAPTVLRTNVLITYYRLNRLGLRLFLFIFLLLIIFLAVKVTIDIFCLLESM